jgi:hypothetical protein
MLQPVKFLSFKMCVITRVKKVFKNYNDVHPNVGTTLTDAKFTTTRKK